MRWLLIGVLAAALALLGKLSGRAAGNELRALSDRLMIWFLRTTSGFESELGARG